MSPTEPRIPWSTLTKFVKQISHDVRNHLNAIELQGTFLVETAGNPEAKAEAQRLRESISKAGADLTQLSRLLSPVRPTTIPYRASEFVEDLQAKLEREQPEEAKSITWQSSLGEEKIAIDPQLVEAAFLELFANAFAHDRAQGAISFLAQATGDAIEFRLQEPKTQFEHRTENWGAQPLINIRHGHYGLGLYRARSIFEAHNGSLRAEYDPDAAVLTTTVCLPCPVS